MKPGIYDDLPINEYHEIQGLSSTGINLLLKSPLHYWDRYLNPQKVRKENYSQQIGSALHMFMLEPDLFEKNYRVAPVINKRTKEGKESWQTYLEASDGKIIISESDMQDVKMMALSLQNHPQAKKILKKLPSAKIEKSLFWIDEETGILCKARPDIWLGILVADIKTTRGADAVSFQRAIFNYGYHVQAAMQLDAINSVEPLSHSNFVHLVVENAHPYVSVYYVLSDDAIELGRQRYKKALAIYKECMEKNEWPGYSNEAVEMNVPAYATL